MPTSSPHRCFSAHGKPCAGEYSGIVHTVGDARRRSRRADRRSHRSPGHPDETHPVLRQGRIASPTPCWSAGAVRARHIPCTSPSPGRSPPPRPRRMFCPCSSPRTRWRSVPTPTCSSRWPAPSAPSSARTARALRRARDPVGIEAALIEAAAGQDDSAGDREPRPGLRRYRHRGPGQLARVGRDINGDTDFRDHAGALRGRLVAGLSVVRIVHGRDDD